MHCPSSLLMYWISIADDCSWKVLSARVRPLKKKFCKSKHKIKPQAPPQGSEELWWTPLLVLMHWSSCLIMEVIRHLSGWVICIVEHKITWRFKRGQYWYAEVRAIDLSDTRQGQAEVMRAAIGRRWHTMGLIFCDSSDHSNSVVSGGRKNTQSWNLQRQRDPKICDLSAHCLLCFSGPNSIPSPVCKSAPSSGRISGSSKFNLPALSFILSDQIPY